MTIAVSALHFVKAEEPMLVTVEGMPTEGRTEQSANALGPIVSNPDGSDTLARPEHP